MSASPFRDRQVKLAAVLKEAGVSAYFASTKATMGWLAGLGEEGGERLLTLVLGSGASLELVAPALSAAQAKRGGMEKVRPWKDGENPLDHLRALARDWGLEGSKVAVDDDGPAYLAFALKEAVPGVEVVLGHGLRTEVMAIKEAWELENMTRAGAIADQAFQTALGSIKRGMTERDVQNILFDSMSSQGGTPSFGIIGSGAAAAEPHHETGDDLIQEGQVLLMDFGCLYQGYNSDITRTVSLGEPDPEADRLYQIVLEAHHAARSVIAPGTAYQEADRAARRVIEKAGYGEFFFHRVGHGIGLAIHESPNAVEGETRPFRPGACVSVEPGIYLEGRMGVRIENIVTVTETGHRSFNAEPPEKLIRI